MPIGLQTCILIWEHLSDRSVPQSEHPIDKPFFRGCQPTLYLLAIYPVDQWGATSNPSTQKLQLSRCSAQTATATLNFPVFFRREPVRWLLMADSVAGRPNYVKHRLLLVMSPWQVTGRAGQFSSNNTLNIKLVSIKMIFLCFYVFVFNFRNLRADLDNRSNTTPSQYGIVLKIWEIILMNLLISNFLSCLQRQWVPSKAVAPSAVFAYLGLSGDICLHYQPSPLFPYVRLTTYRREPKCSSGGKENMKLTQLGNLFCFLLI